MITRKGFLLVLGFGIFGLGIVGKVEGLEKSEKFEKKIEDALPSRVSEITDKSVWFEKAEDVHEYAYYCDPAVHMRMCYGSWIYDEDDDGVWRRDYYHRGSLENLERSSKALAKNIYNH